MKLRKIFPQIIGMATVSLNALTFNVNAIEVSNLYQAKILVLDSVNGKAKATKQALKQVLVKFAGNDFVNSNEQIRQELANPDKFLSQYSYTKEAEQTLLTASFEPEKIDTLLQQANARVWGKHRPLMTIWMVDEDGASRQVVADSNIGQDKKTLLKVAYERGLPVNFPLMDLTDSMNLTVSDIWGRFSENLILASKRYLAEAVVVIRVSNSTLVKSSGIVVDWKVFLNGEMLQNSVKGGDKQQTITAAINDLADTLHQINSYQFNDQQQSFLDLEITQVSSIKGFHQVSELLVNLSSVSEVKLIKVDGQSMLFRLTILADENAIRQALKFEGDLIENFEIHGQVEDAPSMSFHWKGE